MAKTTTKPNNTTVARKRAASPVSNGLPANTVASLRVDRMKIESLNPHPRNKEIRKHPEPDSAEWRVMVKSLEHDYFDPVVWNERNGFLVSGHLRTKIMASMGITALDVVVVDYDESTHIARMLAANKTAGTDEVKGMKSFFEELKTSGFSTDLTGYGAEALANLGINLPKADKVVADKEDNNGSSEANYASPGDKIPLALAYSATEHLEVMAMLRASRTAKGTKEGRKLADITNAEVVFDALRHYANHLGTAVPEPAKSEAPAKPARKRYTPEV